MINKYRIITNRVLDTLISMEKTTQTRLEELKGYEGLSLKKDKRSNGKEYYSVVSNKKKNGKREYMYIGAEFRDSVRYIKELRHLEAALKVIGKDIRALEKVLSDVKPFDAESIDRGLPATYRNAVLSTVNSVNPRAALWKKMAENKRASQEVFHPEELIHETDDGTMVRSKSERLIYNLLLRLGITFVYELPTKTVFGTRYPDFTLLSEVDYKTTFIIEHQGMMDKPEYREKFPERVYDYLCSGYVSGVNIYYTFDGIDGSLNLDPVLDIIKLKIRPEVWAN